MADKTGMADADEAPRHILVIGMGAGDPDHLTLAAVKAMRRADVFFVLGKGKEKESLTRLRRDILDEHLTGPYRVVEADDPWRDRTQDDATRYTSAVHDWRHRRADICERLIIEELAPGQCGAFLVWGDPALYDSTLAILDDIRGRGTVEFGHEVIPGISSVSALAARHRVTLNQVGRPIHITPGRRLAQGFPEDDGDIVVMLDGHETFTHLTGRGLWIHWGAYIGTPDEILVAGPLDEVADEISRVRAEARERHGWIMDTYLLRQGPRDDKAAAGEEAAGRPADGADGSVGGPLG
ncbi:precorrin-6A synthase (deacetylating) [Streptomyces rubiginosohelvolus]|uniref:precorrin-6A synthase (deacetylating) n=1 Tax=Streptomyces rubiginosohelvolus TaxID=67362 RepID=UPI0035DBC460